MVFQTFWNERYRVMVTANESYSVIGPSLRSGWDTVMGADICTRPALMTNIRPVLVGRMSITRAPRRPSIATTPLDNSQESDLS